MCKGLLMGNLKGNHMGGDVWALGKSLEGELCMLVILKAEKMFLACLFISRDIAWK